MTENSSVAKKSLSHKEILTIFIIVVNAFTWYFVMFIILKEIINGLDITSIETVMIWSLHFGGVVSAALLGAILSDKLISRNNLLCLWMVLGVISSLAVPTIENTCATIVLVISFLLGFSFGLGMPSCMGYYADSTTTENRGRLGGIMYFAIGLGIFSFGIFILHSLLYESVFLAIWRAFGLVVFFLFKRRSRLSREKKIPSYKSVACSKPFLLYLFPWTMFCLVNYLTVPVTNSLFPSDIARISTLIESVIIGLFALIGGLLSDLVGRKRVVISGFVFLGVGYAVIGILPEILISWYFYAVADGVAWGIFGAIFLMILWGDLANNMKPEKYYAIGSIPYLLSVFLQLIIADYIINIILVYTVFSLASFFLFLAVIPLMYAPETLPEKKIKERELKKYVEKAKKVRKKYD